MKNGDILNKCRAERTELRKKLILTDTEPWQLNKTIYNQSNKSESALNGLRYVAGLAISYVKTENTACSGLFVFDITNNMKIVYQDIDEDLIPMEEPEIAGFREALAYREAPFLIIKLNRLKETKPNFYPQCLFVAGNGLMHEDKFGMACHIGVLTNTPAIGISKKLCQSFGLEDNQEHREKIKSLLLKAGDCFKLMSNEEEPTLLGYTYRSTEDSINPIYVSIGHKISWETCLWILKLVITKNRIPEPIRLAEINTRVRRTGLQASTKKGFLNA